MDRAGRLLVVIVVVVVAVAPARSAVAASHPIDPTGVSRSFPADGNGNGGDNGDVNGGDNGNGDGRGGHDDGCGEGVHCSGAPALGWPLLGLSFGAAVLLAVKRERRGRT